MFAEERRPRGGVPADPMPATPWPVSNPEGGLPMMVVMALAFCWLAYHLRDLAINLAIPLSSHEVSFLFPYPRLLELPARTLWEGLWTPSPQSHLLPWLLPILERLTGSNHHYSIMVFSLGVGLVTPLFCAGAAWRVAGSWWAALLAGLTAAMSWRMVMLGAQASPEGAAGLCLLGLCLALGVKAPPAGRWRGFLAGLGMAVPAGLAYLLDAGQLHLAWMAPLPALWAWRRGGGRSWRALLPWAAGWVLLWSLLLPGLGYMNLRHLGSLNLLPASAQTLAGELIPAFERGGAGEVDSPPGEGPESAILVPPPSLGGLPALALADHLLHLPLAVPQALAGLWQGAWGGRSLNGILVGLALAALALAAWRPGRSPRPGGTAWRDPLGRFAWIAVCLVTGQVLAGGPTTPGWPGLEAWLPVMTALSCALLARVGRSWFSGQVRGDLGMELRLFLATGRPGKSFLRLTLGHGVGEAAAWAGRAAVMLLAMGLLFWNMWAESQTLARQRDGYAPGQSAAANPSQVLANQGLAIRNDPQRDRRSLPVASLNLSAGYHAQTPSLPMSPWEWRPEALLEPLLRRGVAYVSCPAALQSRGQSLGAPLHALLKSLAETGWGLLEEAGPGPLFRMDRRFSPRPLGDWQRVGEGIALPGEGMLLVAVSRPEPGPEQLVIPAHQGWTLSPAPGGAPLAGRVWRRTCPAPPKFVFPSGAPLSYLTAYHQARDPRPGAVEYLAVSTLGLEGAWLQPAGEGGAEARARVFRIEPQ